MLRITVPGGELWDEGKLEFVYAKDQQLQLEHSLVSLSKWESKWNKPFISKEEKTFEETIDYIKCMTLTQNVKPEVYTRLTEQNLNEITDYINAPMTATILSKNKNKEISREIITSEIIYYWMIALNIPLECQKWHLNRLIKLIEVVGIKNTPEKKMSPRETTEYYAKLNAERRKKWNTKE